MLRQYAFPSASALYRFCIFWSLLSRFEYRPIDCEHDRASAVHHLVFKTNFCPWLRLLGWKCVITANFIAIRSTIAEFCYLTVFTARRSYASAVLGVVIMSVCPSVCHTCALWVMQRTYRRYFCTTWKGNPSGCLHPTVVGGRRPLPPKMGDQSDPPLQKSLTSTDLLL